MNSKIEDALRTVLEYTQAKANLDDPMLHELDSAVYTLQDYLQTFNPENYD